MTKEEKFVVRPLVQYFKKQKANWGEPRMPSYGTGATGWDLEVRRHNQDLLIEAKYITGAFIASLNGMVTAPLTRRPQRSMKSGKYRSWSYGICWAIGWDYLHRDVYQLLLDYFSRELPFWRHYASDLRMKYIFFVEDGAVAKIGFEKMLDLAERYESLAKGSRLDERRRVARELTGLVLKFTSL